MKKILLAVMAVAAIGFTASCGNKTQQGADVDSVAIVDSLAGAAAQESIDALSAELESGDATKLQAALEAVKAKIAELLKNNPEVAKQYVAKVQTFLKDNAEQIKSVVGDNAAVSAAVAAVTAIEPEGVVNSLLNAVDSTATKAADKAGEAASDAVSDAKQAAEDKAKEVKDAAKDQANQAIDNAAKDIKKGLGL